MSKSNGAYEAFVKEMRQIGVLGSVASALGWDEQTYMPSGAAGHRGDQQAMLAGMIHERFTSEKMGDLLASAEAEVKAGGSGGGFAADSAEAANVRETKRTYARQKKLPGELVEELSKTTVMAQQAWAGAKKVSDWAAFSPWLEKVMKLKMREIECYGYEKEPYDAVLEDYEPGATAEEVRGVFESLRGELVGLVGKIMDSGKKAPLEVMERKFDKAAQERVSRAAAEAVGFDFNCGRIDVAAHPFCTDLGPGDVRMTTRYDEQFFGDAFFSTLHETGHALYEQGLPREQFGLPAGQAISLGIHESQSRMWENLVGRSGAFWKHFLPKVREAFPAALEGVSDGQWLWAVNDIRPSLIRTESDEATYNLHVLIRFEMETAILSGQMKVGDIPGAWNEKYRKYLGVDVPDHARGCMQDVHWSAGLVGYFPTYTLGNLYAAQFFEKAVADLGGEAAVEEMFGRGEFGPLLGWLREKIHKVGKRVTAGELCKRITGKALSAEPLLKHLKRKGKEFYGV